MTTTTDDELLRRHDTMHIFDLSRALASNVTEARNVIPILDCARLIADGGAYTVTTTDLDMQVTAQGDCEPGAVDLCIGARDLAQIAKGAASLMLTRDGADKATVASDVMTATLQATASADFPDMQRKAAVATLTLPAAELAAACKTVAPFMSKEATRYYLNGAFLTVDNGRPRLVATDGHRMAVQDFDGALGGDMPRTSQQQADPGLIIPTKAVLWLAKHLAKMPGDAVVSLHPEQVCVTAGHLAMTTRVIDGAFPSYGCVIPRDNAGAVISCDDTKAATATVKRLLAVNKVMRLEGCTARAGDSLASMPWTVRGECLVGFNGKHIIDALAPASRAVIQLDKPTASSAQGPALITYPDRPDLLTVLMPFRL